MVHHDLNGHDTLRCQRLLFLPKEHCSPNAALSTFKIAARRTLERHGKVGELGLQVRAKAICDHDVCKRDISA
jgi:hypothetical protein